ncbi:exopolyphosphatase/guanosine-5'-triphosphate,3'-diphosphate pyrophosphatase [Bacillus tianshenii]|uniref:Exopolyphosphatase/guanosine-5'-triphosphate, 3'-diphosphate pyrophosphatase n=1 Tax=Sutcliffiella tianshenii TaxID=1463404 RepID=A0ABS2P4K6_9BACI|nr:Ppx/GppA family phosphatase [Bacillus tianshenii]MBM7621799.1 exopolyphosphatase/guanosine-5'-triphosphate,3'-diphosphate pyrophosphatase [Bacillus tianshenii]
MKGKYGIIDIGSNTMRLVIYKRDKSGRLKEVENVKSVARLRNYLNHDEYLSENGVHKLITTLSSFRAITDFHQLEEVKCVATATIRQATNREVIQEMVQRETGFSMTILSEYEEAYFGYLAVVNTTPFTEGITIDIGGGSTEITYFKDRELVEYHSFPFGALSLKKQFVKNELPTQSEKEEIHHFIRSQFDSLHWIKNKMLPIIGIGGSARNMVQIDQAMKNYPLAGLHLYEMPPEDIRLLGIYVNSLPLDKLLKLEGLSKDRAELMLPALMVFDELASITKAPSFILSRKGLREGVFYESMKIHPTKAFDVLTGSFDDLTKDYEINMEEVKQVTRILMCMVDELNRLNVLAVNEQERMELKRAANVFQLGDYIDAESSSQHTFYLLANRTIDGLMHKERLKLALMASFKNKTVFKQYANPFRKWFAEEELRVLRLYGAMLKFSYSLNATKRNVVDNVEVTQEADGLLFHIKTRMQSDAEEYQAERQKKHLEKLMKHPIHLRFY